MPTKLLFLAAFFTAICWILLIPIWQYPDEQAHFGQVQDLAELGHVPATGFNTSQEIAYSEKVFQTDRDISGNNKFIYHPEFKPVYSNSFDGSNEKELSSIPKNQRTNLVKKEATNNPPLYYLLSAVIYRLFYDSSLITRVYAVRLLSIVFYLATLFVTLKISQIIFKGKKVPLLILPAFVAFSPMFIFASTGVLPDTLTNFLFTAVIYLGLKILTDGIKISYLITLLVVVVLGILTRQQFLISLSIPALVYIFRIIPKISPVSFVLKLAIAVLFLFILKDQIVYLIYVSPIRIPDSSSFKLINLFSIRFIYFLNDFTRHFIAETFPWYFGVYKWLSLTLPHIIYQIINRLIILSIIGVVIKILHILLRRKLKQTDIIFLFLILISISYFLIFAMWDYLFFSSHGFHFGYQGRYFFPLITSHMAILIFGFWQVFGILPYIYQKSAQVLLTFLMIIFTDFSLAYVASSYYDLGSTSTLIKEISQYKPTLLKGNILVMIIFATLIFQSIFMVSLGKSIFTKSDESIRRSRT